MLFPHQRTQAEAVPDADAANNPSLWLYAVLLFLAVLLVTAAFSLQVHPDWPGLFLNLAAGLIGSVVILIFVDRRLRAREVAALGSLPGRATWTLASIVFPTKRFAIRYTRRLLVTLEPMLQGVFVRDQFQGLDERARSGFVLLGRAGEGKTTWLQRASAKLAREYLERTPKARLPILLSLGRWRPNVALDDVLYRSATQYAACGRSVFRRVLSSGQVALLLDAYDEISDHEREFETEVVRLRSQYPGIAWTFTARTSRPPPSAFGKTAVLTPLTSEESSALQSWFDARRPSRGGTADA
jgi:hypothetical protein